MSDSPSLLDESTVSGLPLVAMIVVAAILGVVMYALFPRPGGSKAPPLVTSSPVSPLPYVLGVINEFLKSPNDMMKRCLKEHGNVFSIPLFNQRMTFLIGPEAQKAFFTASDEVMSQDEVYHFMKPIFGPGVVYDTTKKRRQVQFQTMANGLRTGRMKTYVTKVQRETKMFLDENWNKETGTIDLFKDLGELTILSASRCLHGDDVREHMFKELQTLYHDLDAGLTPLTTIWSTAPTAAHQRRDAARQELVQLFSKIIAQRKANPGSSDGTDIMQLFIDMKYKDGTHSTDEQVTGLLIAMLFAGQHTSCITGTWLLMYLSQYPEILSRVRDEQKKTVPVDQDGEPSLDLDSVNNLGLLHDCMREVVRLCPTFILMLRKAMKDIPITVKGETMVIPKGDYIAASPTVSMRMESTFPNADKFDPDRYGPGREEHKIPFAYMGFGGGIHSCIGQSFAFMQVKTIVSTILYYYDLELETGRLPDIGYNDMVVGPKGNCNVIYRKRAVPGKSK